MTDSDLSLIIDRISMGTHTPADTALLRQLLDRTDGESVLQLGKYNVSIGQGRDIQIGDRVYPKLDNEAVQAIVAAVQQKIVSEQQPGRVRMAANPPRSGVAQLVGRDRELKTLHDLLSDDDRVVSIAGMGGVGKSELAVQYAKRHKSDYPGGIYWLQARSGNLAAQILTTADLPNGMDVPQTLDDRPLSLEEQVQWCWDNWQAAGTVLIVIDDVVDAIELQDLLPTDPRFRVMLTTRTRGLDASFEELSIDELLPDAAVQLLKQLLPKGDRRIEREPEAAASLCEWLGYLPLGLELVGRYLGRDRALSLSAMLDRLKAKRIEDKSLDRAPRYVMTAERGVRAAFELTWELLEPATQTVALLLSFFAPAAIPWSLVEAMMMQAQDESSAADAARSDLDNVYLIKPVDDTFTVLTIHPLIREFLQTKQTRAEQPLRQAFVDVLVAVAKQMPYTPVRQQIDAFTAVAPHLKAVAQEMLDCLDDENLIWAFTGVARFYEGEGLYTLAEPWYEQCLETTQARFGDEHPDVAKSLNNLALLYSTQGHYSKAEPLYVRALDLHASLFSEEHLEVSSSLNHLALLFSDQGRYGKAEPLLMLALEMSKRLFGQEHFDVAQSLNNLALLYSKQGRYGEAEPLHVEAIALFKRLVGEYHPHVAQSLNNLAHLYHFQGRYGEAESLYVQVLRMRQRLFGEEHLDVANSLNDLAGLYNCQGHYDEAESLHVQALTLYRCRLGEEHPDVANSINNLAALYYSQGHYEEAEPLYVQALKMRQRLLGEEHPDVAGNLNDLALLYYSQGHYEKAESLHVQALKMRQRLLGEEHPDVAQSLDNLALTYCAQERYEEAEPLHVQALKMRQRLLGEEHPDVASVLNNLAFLYKSQGRYEEAEPLYGKALTLRISTTGEKHPDVATSLSNLAMLYYAQGHYSEAEPMLVQAVEICEQLLRKGHPNTVGFSRNLRSIRSRLYPRSSNSIWRKLFQRGIVLPMLIHL